MHCTLNFTALQHMHMHYHAACSCAAYLLTATAGCKLGSSSGSHNSVELGKLPDVMSSFAVVLPACWAAGLWLGLARPEQGDKVPGDRDMCQPGPTGSKGALAG
jgi:hypothetical protein